MGDNAWVHFLSLSLAACINRSRAKNGGCVSHMNSDNRLFSLAERGSKGDGESVALHSAISFT